MPTIKEVSIIPDWLKENLETKCPYCGSEYQVGFSPNGLRVTKHFCPNPKCPATIAMKMSHMWTILKVPNIKFKRSLDLVRTHHLTNHLDAIPLIVESKPVISPAVFMRLNCIPGIDSAWDSICKDKTSIKDILESYEVRGKLTEEDKEEILRCTELFDIRFPEKQKHECEITIAIMITGGVNGFSNREDFPRAINSYYEGRVNCIYYKSKRCTNVSALIKEEGSPTTGKVRTAVEHGIPILTPGQLLVWINNQLNKGSGTNDS